MKCTLEFTRISLKATFFAHSKLTHMVNDQISLLCLFFLQKLYFWTCVVFFHQSLNRQLHYKEYVTMQFTLDWGWYMKREKLNVPLFKMSIQMLHTLLFFFFNKYDEMQLRNSFLIEEIEEVSKKASLLFQNTKFLAYPFDIWSKLLGMYFMAA